MADPGFRKEPGFLLWGFGTGMAASRAGERRVPDREAPCSALVAPGEVRGGSGPGRLDRRLQALARACAAASLLCSSGMIFAAASSPARIAALRCVKSLALIAAKFGRITTSAYLSSS
ncbi:hypothetical protein DRA46_01254 [Burkholderia gladioli]|nr:hypothetical protein [Burkholderia gladioli]